MLNHYVPVDMSAWPQAAVMNFFSYTKQPYFEISLKIRVTKAREYAKKHNVSFYFVMCYLATKACNELINWRYRFVGHDVVLYDQLNPGCTDKNPDEDKFHFIMYPYDAAKSIAEQAYDIQEASRKANQLVYNPMGCDEPCNIHFTSLPWLEFTSLVNLQPDDPWVGTPAISFGKFSREGEELMMPISIQVNHWLLDGADVAEYIEHLQRSIDEL